jgi:hypothetical protein
LGKVNREVRSGGPGRRYSCPFSLHIMQEFAPSPSPPDLFEFFDYKDINFKLIKFGGHYHHEVKTGC